MKHLMIDIETLGREPGCVILSIAAIPFEPLTNNRGSEKFLAHIDVLSSIIKNYKINEETVKFWAKQPRELIRDTQKNACDIEYALTQLAEFIKENECERIWCQGAAFDIPILEHAFKKHNIDIPWLYYNVRDTRTLYDVCDFDPKSIERQGKHHDALDDCHYQIECVYRALKKKNQGVKNG